MDAPGGNGDGDHERVLAKHRKDAVRLIELRELLGQGKWTQALQDETIQIGRRVFLESPLESVASELQLDGDIFLVHQAVSTRDFEVLSARVSRLATLLESYMMQAAQIVGYYMAGRYAGIPNHQRAIERLYRIVGAVVAGTVALRTAGRDIPKVFRFPPPLKVFYTTGAGPVLFSQGVSLEVALWGQLTALMVLTWHSASRWGRHGPELRGIEGAKKLGTEDQQVYAEAILAMWRRYKVWKGL